jgi:putative ABC transport system permease protein
MDEGTGGVSAPTGTAGRNPLWRKAPTVLLRQPGLFAALALGAVLLAVTLSAYPLFLSANASQLVDAAIRDPTVTRFGAGLMYRNEGLPLDATIKVGGTTVPVRRWMGRTFTEMARSPYLGPVVSSVFGPPVEVSSVARPDSTRTGTLFSGTGALEHVQVLSGAEGPGVWLPDLVADPLHVGPGDRIELSFEGGPPARVSVDGVFRALYALPRTGYWRPWHDLIYTPCPDCSPPPQIVIADLDQLLSLSETIGAREHAVAWQAPLREGADLTLEDAERLRSFEADFHAAIQDGDTRVGRVFHCCDIYFSHGGWRHAVRQKSAYSSAIGLVVDGVETRMAAIEGPGRVLQITGGLVALLVMAGAGVFITVARRVEGRLLAARGFPPWQMAAKACVESALPCVAGALLGLALAAAAVSWLGPDGAVGAGARGRALVGAAGAALASIAVVGLVSGLSYLREFEHHRERAARLARLPWEVLLLAGAALAFRRLDAGGAFVTDPATGTQRPSLALVVFPILLLAGGGLLGARALGAALRAVRRRSGPFRPASYLAVRRLAASSRLPVLLVAGAVLCLGISLQAQTTVRSLQATVDAKARIYVGSDVQGRLDYRTPSPRALPFPFTRVVRYPSGALLSTGEPVDVLAVDADTFAQAAFWRDGFSDVPLDEMARRLAGGADGSVPIVAVGDIGTPMSIEIAQRQVPVHVVARASSFPGASSLRPLVVADRSTLLAAEPWVFDPLNVSSASSELWVRGPERAVNAALAGTRYPPYLTLTAGEVKDISYIDATVDTFVVLNVLGLVAALLVIAGTLMYLQSRQRSQAVSYALSLRMGMSHDAHQRAVLYELLTMLGSSYALGAALAIVAAALVIPMLDPIAAIPPGPLFEAPRWSLAMGIPLVLAVAAVGAWSVSRRARATDLGEVMRVAE